MLGRMGHLPGRRPGHRHVAHNSHGSGYFSLMVVNWRDRMFNRNFKAITPDEDTVLRQVPGAALPVRHQHWILSGCTTGSVGDAEYLPPGPAACLFRNPTPTY